MRASERPGTGLALTINISARPRVNLSLFGFKSSRGGVGGRSCSANNNNYNYNNNNSNYNNNNSNYNNNNNNV